MKVKGLTPILNVSNIVESFEWFAKLGSRKVGTGATRQPSVASAMASLRSFSTMNESNRIPRR
jgi:hypothetical protein